MELERSWRVFERDSRDARFEVITDVDEALALFSQMELMQRQLMLQKGKKYVLDRSEYQAFYRDYLSRGLVEGSALLTVLKNGDELVAALYGIKIANSYAMLRLAQDQSNWSHCSLGKLVIERTMQWLHAQGVNYFDFTTGDYSYKNRFGVETNPLFNMELGLSWRGRLILLKRHGVEYIKSYLANFPKVYLLIKKIAQKIGLA